MDKPQKQLLAIFLPLTMFFIVLDNLYPGAPWVNYLKFAAIISLFLTAARTPKRYLEQRILTAAMFFVMVGDFFLVFCSTLFDTAGRTLPLGVLGFAIAYLLLITAFTKDLKISWRKAAAAVPILAISIPVIITLFPFVSGIIRYGLLLFISILCIASWSCICTVCEGYFTPQSSYRIALAGILMLVCDLGVGLSLFAPKFAGHLVPWVKNIIWGSYIPAWTLIAITVQEKKLYNK